jgi:hypothetical protein
MKGNRYLQYVFIAIALSSISFALVLNRLHPLNSPKIALPLFFITFFVLCASVLTLVGFWFRQWLYEKGNFYNQIGTSFRQAIFLSLITVFSLLLKRIGYLNWLSAFIVIALFLILEYYLSPKD